MVRKLRAGRYDKQKAPKGWAFLVEQAAKRYVREVGREPVSKWSVIFPPATRDAVAVALARDFEARYAAGDWER
jgi:hypothetical protein